MNRQRAIILLAIVEAIIYIPLIVLLGLGKMSILAGIISFVIIAIITMALVVFIVRKYPPMDE